MIFLLKIWPRGQIISPLKICSLSIVLKKSTPHTLKHIHTKGLEIVRSVRGLPLLSSNFTGGGSRGCSSFNFRDLLPLILFFLFFSPSSLLFFLSSLLHLLLSFLFSSSPLLTFTSSSLSPLLLFFLSPLPPLLLFFLSPLLPLLSSSFHLSFLFFLLPLLLFFLSPLLPLLSSSSSPLLPFTSPFSSSLLPLLLYFHFSSPYPSSLSFLFLFFLFSFRFPFSFLALLLFFPFSSRSSSSLLALLLSFPFLCPSSLSFIFSSFFLAPLLLLLPYFPSTYLLKVILNITPSFSSLLEIETLLWLLHFSLLLWERKPSCDFVPSLFPLWKETLMSFICFLLHGNPDITPSSVLLSERKPQCFPSFPSSQRKNCIVL